MINESTRLLVICSSRNRPNQLMRMIESFEKTRSDSTELFIYVSNDDPRLEDYKFIFSNNFKHNYEIGNHKYLVQVNNYAATQLFPYIKYYGEVNDDHVYETINWDQKLIAAIEQSGGWGISHGRSLVNDYPSACVTSGNIVRTLGYLHFPAYTHLNVDLFIRDLGLGIGKLIFVPEVIVHHIHGHLNKEIMDDNYIWVYSSEQQKIGDEAHKQWLAVKDQEITKVLKAMGT